MPDDSSGQMVSESAAVVVAAVPAVVGPAAPVDWLDEGQTDLLEAVGVQLRAGA